MSDTHVRHGFGTVRPYIYGPLSVANFVRETFDAVEMEKHAFSATAFHIEARIGDSALVLEVSDPPHAGARPASVYVYVTDVDACYARALSCGCKTVSEPTDKPYQERSCGVSDAFGNIWYIATYTGA
jgi:PhnB protein